MGKSNNTKNDKFLMAGEEKNTKKRNKIYIGFDVRVIVYGVLIFILLMSTFVSYFSLYLNCADKVVSFKEESDVIYNVCLDNNNIYNDPCLKEGMEYLSVLTNRVNSKFSYDVEFSSEIKYDLEYKVTAKTKIFTKDDNKILYEKEEEIISPKRISDESTDININQIVELDYKKYKDVANNYIGTYAPGADATVEVIFYLIEPTETRKLATLNVPLASQTFNISKEIISYSDDVHLSNNYWNDDNTLYGVIGTISLLLLMFCVFRLTKMLVIFYKNDNKYEVELKKLLKEYDEYIVITKEGFTYDENKNIIKVSNFKELLDARNTLNKPILYSRINNVKSEFIVEDESVIYKYVLKEADLD